MIGGIGFESAT